MNTAIPSPEQVREALSGLSMLQMEHLAVLANVGARTIYKIKRGTTENPGIGTANRILEHVSAARSAERAVAIEAVEAWKKAKARRAAKAARKVA